LLKQPVQIHSADELILTELILENVLSPYTPEEIVALLSSFVFQEKTDVIPQLTPTLQAGVTSILSLTSRITALQASYQILLPPDSLSSAPGTQDSLTYHPRFGLVEVVHAWASGMSFKNIMALTDVLEGTIVRVVTRLDETCREVRGAARIVGDPELWAKMGVAQERIRRDVMAVGSLYL